MRFRGVPKNLYVARFPDNSDTQFVLQLIGNNVLTDQVIIPCGFAQKFSWYGIAIIYAQPVVMGRPHNSQERELCSFQIRGCPCIYLINHIYTVGRKHIKVSCSPLVIVLDTSGTEI